MRISDWSSDVCSSDLVRPASTQVDDLMSEITDRVKKNERVLVTTLTKRMAEQLTEFLSDNGIKVRYLHSDIDTVEQIGRASCRESVCQTVSIPVAARSLHKHQPTHPPPTPPPP